VSAPLVRGGTDIRAAADAVLALLGAAVDRDWSVPVPGLDFTVASVVAHAVEAPIWYAVDLWEGPTDNAAYEVRARADAGNGRLLNSLVAGTAVCAASVDAAPSSTRGFHPCGAPDPEGFAAMACDELLVHGHDAARGLGLTFAPDDDLAERVLLRLFPWHADDRPDDPWTALLWANGRITPPGRPRREGWRWHCAPLAEWDGTDPLPRTGGAGPIGTP
jgi:uncharacterized protein (TIGR03083 family)